MNIRYIKALTIFAVSSCFAEVPYMSQPCSMQDKYLNENIFHNKTNGVFVDIGAHDGKKYSNTYYFEKALGWSGVCIEPIKSEFEKLRKNRNCLCVNSCVSDVEGTVKFIKVDSKSDGPGNSDMVSGMLATYGKQGLERLKQHCKQYNVSYQIIKIPSRKVSSILKENNITKVDYISIDVEGAELSVLKSIDFNAVQVHVLSIENNFNTPDIKQYLIPKGFVLHTKLDQDEIYINPNFK